MLAISLLKIALKVDKMKLPWDQKDEQQGEQQGEQQESTELWNSSKYGHFSVD